MSNIDMSNIDSLRKSMSQSFKARKHEQKQNGTDRAPWGRGWAPRLNGS